jgi:sulfite reductase alpha subunit-like flavoprotein/cytochrome b involved in lipid metabolism
MRQSAPDPARRDARALPEAPAEVALRRLELRNVRAGHENAGFLSRRHGFMPVTSPLARLDQRYAAWDQLAAELPSLYRSLALRRRVDELPMLDATVASLDERELLRACALLAFLSHAYWYADCRPPTALPEVIRKPWAEARERLGRRQEVISYIDLVVYNWKIIEPRHDDLTVENLDLLFPTIGNQEERVFYLTQLEILARASPVVALSATAQGAVLREDDEAIEQALIGVSECLAQLVGRSLPKINPNPWGKNHVDPVVWAKTVAPFAVPIQRGDQGPSGTSSPLFNTLDVFFGRNDFSSFLGREIKQLRATYPLNWQLFLRALSEVSVARYVEHRNNPALRAAFREAFELYAGQGGFLERHRRKVYGYLELAFKVGRAITIGGFGGVFKDRTWDLVDDELMRAHAERARELPNPVQQARVVRVEAAPDHHELAVRCLLLDISRAGVRYRAGDRCLILPENDPALVACTLAALGASGAESVRLTDEWRAHARDRTELAGRTDVSTAELLRFGAIRPVSMRLAEALHARTQSPLLLDAILRGKVDRWELWELLELLRQSGFATETLWAGAGAASDSLCRLIPPQHFRAYSISSAPNEPARKAQTVVELTVRPLQYPRQDLPRPGSTSSRMATARGTGSQFLIRALDSERSVPFRLERSEIFRLPEHPQTPIVMFASGSGIAPFRAFIAERARTARAGPAWLFLALRSLDDFVYREELASALASGWLTLELTFTRAGARSALEAAGRIALEPAPVASIAERMLEPSVAERLWHLSLAKELGGGGASFYVCGTGAFAKSVIETLTTIFRRRTAGEHEERAALELVYQLAGDRRLLQEIHGGGPALEGALLDLSEIAQHNDAERGYWIVVDRVVYDVTEFMQLHPGGRRVLQAYAGMDATHGFARAHPARPDVDAMRERYRIGMLRTLALDGDSAEALGTVAYRAVSQALGLVVEMQNALSADQAFELGSSVAREHQSERSPYELLRRIETHRRFLHNCFAVLVAETLPALWRSNQPAFFADRPLDWLECQLAALRRSDAARMSEAIALDAVERFETWHGAGETEHLAAAFDACDAWFLRTMKRALVLVLREFERHGPAVRVRGATRVRRACQYAAAAVRRYLRRASRPIRGMNALEASCARRVVWSQSGAPPVRQVHAGAYWLFEERPQKRLAVLRRTPKIAVSLSELCDENEKLLCCLQPEHRSWGLVVDMRQARIRNDAGFEAAMARLRRELQAYFQRTAVLIESSIGELQVSRIERDEGGRAIATCNESTAFKFAQGGA